MNKRVLTVATCQFDISGDLQCNLAQTLSQIEQAKLKKADIVHFPECSLTGYGGIDIPRIRYEDYSEVVVAIDEVKETAKSHSINVILGAHHFATNTRSMPKNSLYFINSLGQIETRYDKRILTGTQGSMDHNHYSPGDLPVIFQLNGIQCGMLICHEWRYPELYREYKKLGVELLFQSWYDGGLNGDEYVAGGIHTGELIVGAARSYAANNYFWISGSNTSETESCFPGFVIQPDGRIFNQSPRNHPDVLISRINFDNKYNDPSFYGRRRYL